MYEFNTTITASGESVFMQIISTSGTAYFSRLIFSENNYVGQEHSLNILTFDGVFDSRSASATIIDSRNIKVSAAINAPTQDNTLYSIGVVVRYQGLDYLAAVCTTSNPMPISQGAGNTYSFNVNISVSSTENITVVGTTAAALYDTDIADNLTTADATMVLSANMGHALADNLAANENVYGAKQMIPYPYSETTKTENGVTFTDNGNGTISVSGTPSVATQFICNTFYLPNGTYKLSGGIAGGSVDTYMVCLTYSDTLGGNTFVYSMNNLSTEFTINGSYGDLDGAMCTVYIYQAVTLTSGSTFKPMVCDARITDPTFVPYAMTNRELTENVKSLGVKQDLSFVSGSSTVTIDSQIVVRQGNIAWFMMSFTTSASIGLYETIARLINSTGTNQTIATTTIFTLYDGLGVTNKVAYIDQYGDVAGGNETITAGSYIMTGTFFIV